MPGLRVTDWFEYTAKTRPQLSFLEMDGRVVRYAEADAWANRWAQALHAAGLRIGDRVACLSTNSIEMCILLMAAAKIGVAPLMLNYRLAPREWLGILRDAEPAAVFARGAQHAAALAALELDAVSPGMPRVAFDVGAAELPPGWRALDDWLAGHPATRPDVQADADDMLYLIYTSGTTGLPKGVMISHTNVVMHVEQSMTASPAKKAPGERALVTTPLYHAAGIHRVVNAAVKGGTVVLLEHFDGPTFVDTLVRERINSCNMVPSIMQTLLDEIPDLASRDFSQLEVIYYGAAPVSVSLLKRMMQTFRCHLIQGYGLTESSGGFVYLNEWDHQRALNGDEHLLLSTGQPVLADVKVVDAEGNNLPPGQPGELLMRGANVMKGYWRNPAATAEVLRDGWLHSGDVAAIDAEGYVYLRDRVKDMIVSGGTNIYPREVENALLEHPAIADAAVIGVPDPKWGEALLAVCVARAGHARPDDAALVAFCRERLGGYKVPRHYSWRDALPRNPSGKVLKRELRAPYWADQGRGIA